MPVAAQFRDAFLAAEKRFRGRRPSAQMALGWIVSSWRYRNCPQISISSGSGVRFSGGRHFTTLQM